MGRGAGSGRGRTKVKERRRRLLLVPVLHKKLSREEEYEQSLLSSSSSWINPVLDF